MTTNMIYLRGALFLFAVMLSLPLLAQPWTEVGTFSHPNGYTESCDVAIKSGGLVYTAYCNAGIVAEYTANGSYITDVSATGVNAIAIDHNDNLVVENGNDGITYDQDSGWSYEANDNSVTAYDASGVQQAVNNTLNDVGRMAHDPVNGVVAVTGISANRVWILDETDLSIIDDFFVFRPTGIAFRDNGHVFVSKGQIGEIELWRLNPNGNGDYQPFDYIDMADSPTGALVNPAGLSFSPFNDYLYVTEEGENRVRIISDGVPLPITLREFTVQKDNSFASLSWLSETEINAKGYEVQHSSNGRDFEVIGFLSAKGSGSSYSFRTPPNSGINYYRLKLIDLDGTFEFSDIKSVNFSDHNSILPCIYPNPSTGMVTITESASIFNINGGVVARITVADSEINANQTLHLPKGFYMAQFISGEVQKLTIVD